MQESFSLIPETQKKVETKKLSFETIRKTIGLAIEKFLSGTRKQLSLDTLSVRIEKSLHESGDLFRLSDVAKTVVEDLNGTGEIVLQIGNGNPGKKTGSRGTTPNKYGVFMLGALLTACETEKPPETPKVISSGDRLLDSSLVNPEPQPMAPEVTRILAADKEWADCGPAKPEQAPKECGYQQWTGFTEANPVAVAWMAISNPGTETCSVTITRLELNYLGGDGERHTLSSGINCVQLLADGTQGGWWGQYRHDLSAGSTFELPPNLHAFVHPFGPMAVVPEDATELTVTFAAKVKKGCIASGGMDTYQENAIPNTEPPYTQNGQPTDFIKEAMKTPWVTETIEPREPVSFSIARNSGMERVWYKEKDYDRNRGG